MSSILNKDVAKMALVALAVLIAVNNVPQLQSFVTKKWT